jgi:hypothetical protein
MFSCSREELERQAAAMLGMRAYEYEGGPAVGVIARARVVENRKIVRERAIMVDIALYDGGRYVRLDEMEKEELQEPDDPTIETLHYRRAWGIDGTLSYHLFGFNEEEARELRVEIVTAMEIWAKKKKEAQEPREAIAREEIASIKDGHCHFRKAMDEIVKPVLEAFSQESKREAEPSNGQPAETWRDRPPLL